MNVKIQMHISQINITQYNIVITALANEMWDCMKH